MVVRRGVWNPWLWVVASSLVALFSSFVFMASVASAIQTVPYRVHYQGRLTNLSGATKLDAQYNMTFRLYTAASGGVPIWTEVRETTNRVTITNGQFAVQLGAVTPLTPSMFTTQPLYFEIELPTPASATCSTAACAVYTEGAMTPRLSLGSSAYAMNADTIDGYDSSDFITANQHNIFTGTNLFKNTSNSAAAFGVKTQGDVSLLNIDTTNSRVAIGTNGSGSPALATASNGDVGVGIGLAAPAATLDVGGNVLFENATDSATAFQVSNAGATTLFSADTSASRIHIGPAAADNAAVLLVLDTKNTTGDPAGTPGATYYNSAKGRARCYEQTAWINCTGKRIATLASNFNTDSATYINVPGLAFPVIAGETYQFSALISYSADETDAGSAWSITGPTTSMLSYTSRYTITATTATVNHASAYNIPAAVNAGSMLNGNIAKIEGTLTPTANGTVNVRLITTGSGSRSVTARAGSTITWWY